MSTNLKYSQHHLWVIPEADGIWQAGITDHAQQMLGDIVFVEAPVSGTRLQENQPCGVIESVKTASDLHAPVNGTVISSNETLLSSPEMLNDAPEQTWIFRFQTEDPASIARLMDADAYQKFLDSAGN